MGNAIAICIRSDPRLAPFDTSSLPTKLQRFNDKVDVLAEVQHVALQKCNTGARKNSL